jgi:hypothetical protein
VTSEVVELSLSMSLATIMLDQLAIARRVVEGGHEVVPAWRIETHEGTFHVLTRFDPDKPKQQERAQFLIGRFMVWKMATSYTLTAETSLGPANTGWGALLAVGVSRLERLTVMQRIRRGDAVGFSDPEWLQPHQVDAQYFKMLPRGLTELSAEEAAELTRVFGKSGELPASRVS